MLTDIEISQNAKVEKITKIAEKLNIEEEYLELYGSDKAKINLNIFKKYENKPDGKFEDITIECDFGHDDF